MNRRSFLKSCGVGVVAPLVLVGKVEAKPEMVEVVEVFQKGIPAGTPCYHNNSGNLIPFHRDGSIPYPRITSFKNYTSTYVPKDKRDLIAKFRHAHANTTFKNGKPAFHV